MESATAKGTRPAVGQVWRHKPTDHVAALIERHGTGNGFYTRGDAPNLYDNPDYPGYNLDHWELVSEAKAFFSVTLTGPCQECEGTGKGPPRNVELDSNFTYATLTSCESCLGKGHKRFSTSLQQLAKELKPFLH